MKVSCSIRCKGSYYSGGSGDGSRGHNDGVCGLRSHQRPSPPVAVTVAPCANTGARPLWWCLCSPPAIPAFAPPATLALALACDSSALPSGRGSACHASGGLLRSRLLRPRLLSPIPLRLRSPERSGPALASPRLPPVSPVTLPLAPFHNASPHPRGVAQRTHPQACRRPLWSHFRSPPSLTIPLPRE